ncbi:anaphase-promoting complex subunit 10-like [Bolinopsis microptera]|uniref:anaphase-promoting complex subunit 10-like n=1 Tax=Bolinopsis microptera TaxID=2820187 RepID=UPI00307A02C1
MMEAEMSNDAGGVPAPTNEERVATVTAVDPSALTPTAMRGLRDIGSQATWWLSTCKPGFGVDHLRDNSLETYWQSDGQQPHFININFKRKTSVKSICFYVDYRQDESYTPSRISVRVGNNMLDLVEVAKVEMVEPSGWINVDLDSGKDDSVRAFMLQVAILSNHQNGRDTHLRQVKVYTPALSTPSQLNLNFTSPLLAQFRDLK